MGDPPRMVLTVLVEAFGVADARHYVERQLIPYFVACGVRVEGLSGDGLQRPRLDDPRGSLDDPQPRYCRDLSAATKLLRVGGHGRSTHGIRSFKDKENEFDLSSGGQSWPPLAKYLSSGLGFSRGLDKYKA